MRNTVGIFAAKHSIMIRLSDLEHITDAVENESLQQSSMLKKVVESQQQDLQMSPDVQRIIDGVNQMRERQQIRNRLSTYQRELSDMITGTGVNSYANGGIHIAKSKEGTFTAAASRHGMGVQEFASRVLANKGNYSPAMVKKANFARNAAKWHDYGGPLNVFNGGGPAFVTADTRSTIPEKRQGDAGPYAINEITVTPAGGYYNPIGIYPYEKPLNPSTIEYDLVTGGVFKKPLTVVSKYLGKKFVDSFAQNKNESPYPIDPRKLVELSPLKFAKGGSLRFNNAADMIEHFEGFRSTPYRDGKAYSVGYGQYMYGDGANLDWKGLLNGTKKISKQEAHQQVLRSIDKLKAQLRQTLGDDLYNSLTPGQLMGYLDTGYQRPASMIAAAKIHRQKGAQAAADALHVNGPFAQRNAARRAAFTGNWGSDSPDYIGGYSEPSTGNTGGYMLERPEPIISQPDYSSDTEYNYWWNNEPEEQADDEMLQQYIMASGAGSSVYPLQESTPIIELNSGPAFPQLFSEGGYLSPINIFRAGGRKTSARRPAKKVGDVVEGTRANTKQCAKYTNDYIRGLGYISNGNAWDSSGITTVYSGYDGLKRPKKYNKEEVEAYNAAASDNVYNNFRSGDLNPDKVYTVNMYYKGSPYLETAYNDGTKDRTGTHTGYLKNENGEWYVVHNIHGVVHVDRFKDIQGGGKNYGVTGIYEPRSDNFWNRSITKIGFADGGLLRPINIYGDGDYLIKDDPSYNDFLKEYGLSQTPLEHIQLSDPHFRDAQSHGPGTYITGGPNGYLLTEPEILSKWRSWKLNNDPTQTANYDAPVPLDEVIITPDTDMLNKYQKIIPNKDLRQGLYEYIEGNLNDSDSKGAYNRMLDVLTYNSKSPSFDFNPIFTDSRGGTLTPYAVTSHMGPLANFGSNIYIDGKPSEYPNNRLYDYGFHMFSELPHWLQHLSVNGHRLNDNDLWNFREGYFPDVKMKHNRKRPYSTPGAEEFSAHSIIQPAIGAYVFNTTPHDFVERQLPGYYRNNLMSQNKYWYSRVRPTYQEPIRTMPQLLKFSEDMSRSAANYGYNQYMDWERKFDAARDMWNSGQ